MTIKNTPTIGAVHEYLDSYLGDHISSIDQNKKNLTASLIAENLQHKREEEIQAALERVRVRTMSMQKMDELSEVISLVYKELSALDISMDRCFIITIDEVRNGVTWWMGGAKENLQRGYFIPHHDHEPHLAYMEAWKNKVPVKEYLLTGKVKQKWDNFLFKQTELRDLPQQIIEFMRAVKAIYLTFSVSDFGFLNVATFQPLKQVELDLMVRFTKVFELTYTRFNDLKKAEAQAREAIIQVSLERIRGMAMAMHSTRDLADTIHTFYCELASLHLTPIRCGVGLVDKESHTAELSTMSTTLDGHSVEALGRISLRGHPVLEGVYNNWLIQKEYFPVLRGKQIKKYHEVLKPQIKFPETPEDKVHYGYYFFFAEGGVYAWTEKELQEDEMNIYRKFTSVLSLTYKRYRDLKNAEERAQLAVKEASLDRVRAVIASMRNAQDLQNITPLIWKELQTLGITFVRCGVFIMNDTTQEIQIFLSNPEGAAIAAFNMPYNTPGNYANIIQHWRKKEKYVSHWGMESFHELADILVERKLVTGREQYLSTIPKDGICLHFLPFCQGMLYVGNTSTLDTKALETIQCVADAFSTAYARYDDFIKLEVAKQQVEKTLNELRQAQQQLIHSEKMASLGELTAGIAHEIQNPLNFVNNFSEVNLELAEELSAVSKDGKLEDIQYIVENIRDNQCRILEHGKRAEAIVRSMLMHSRTNSGYKELTDVNSLVDEYVKLAYHGFRSREKDFNVPILTELGSNVGKLELVAQDIGRVILNLMNNALYAVKQRAGMESSDYTPEIRVITRKSKNEVEIIVKDNGPGIPDQARDKIFQPFFTTKPAGEGTGLGLSLSYDIITKGHGGEIRFKSSSVEGTSVIVLLRPR